MMKPPQIIALIVALLGVLLIVRALANGSGSPGGKTYRREDQPVAYWTIITAATALVIFLVHVGLTP